MTTKKLLLDPQLAEIVRQIIETTLAGDFELGQLTLNDSDGQAVDLMIFGTEVVYG